MDNKVREKFKINNIIYGISGLVLLLFSGCSSREIVEPLLSDAFGDRVMISGDLEIQSSQLSKRMKSHIILNIKQLNKKSVDGVSIPAYFFSKDIEEKIMQQKYFEDITVAGYESIVVSGTPNWVSFVSEFAPQDVNFNIEHVFIIVEIGDDIK